METYETQPFAEDFGFLDGLRWHDGHIWASDFFREEVVRIDPADGSRESIAKVDGDPSGLGFLADGTPLVVSQEQRCVFRIENDGSLELHAELSGVFEGDANDMIVNKDGSAYVGGFGFDPRAGEEPKSTNLAFISPDGKASVAAGDLMFPNACVISEDGGTLYLSETFGHCITAFDLGEDGSLSNKRMWADLGDRKPDGMCLDSEGAIWVAIPWGEGFIRVAEGGEILAVIPAPDSWAISCVFGGPDRDVLYCTSAVTSLEKHSRHEGSATIDQLWPGVTGVGSP